MKFLRKISKSSSNDIDTITKISEVGFLVETEYETITKNDKFNKFETLVLLLMKAYKHITLYGIGDKAKSILFGLYDNITKGYYNERTNTILEYSKFLITASQLLLFSNNKDNLIYIQEYDDSTIKIIFTFDTYKVGFAFTSHFASNTSGGLLDEFENKTDTDYICFVEVKRDDGTKSDYTYTVSEENRYHNGLKSDLLLDIILNNVIRYIRESYDQILNNTFQVYTGINNDSNIGWKDICENGLRISTGKKE